MEIWCSLTFYNSNLRQTDQKLSKRFCYSHMLLESADSSSKKLMERKGEGCFFGCYTYTHKTERDIIMGVFYIFQNEISPKCAEVVFEKKKKKSLTLYSLNGTAVIVPSSLRKMDRSPLLSERKGHDRFVFWLQLDNLTRIVFLFGQHKISVYLYMVTNY